MSPQKRAFLVELLKHHELAPWDARKLFAYEIAQQLGIPQKQAYAWLVAYEAKGWWESGVSTRTGWFTAKGWLGARKLVGESRSFEDEDREARREEVEPSWA